jgi:hypothetical protein
MTTFTQTLRDWQVFYTALATACSTLTGLLFVALSLNLDITRRKENAELRAVARQTFSEFLLVLMVALIFLIPHQVPLGLGVALVALGAASTFPVVRGLLRGGRAMRVSGLALAGCLGIVGLGIGVLAGLGPTTVCNLLVFMLAALLVSACMNAWALLVHVRGPRDG